MERLAQTVIVNILNAGGPGLTSAGHKFPWTLSGNPLNCNAKSLCPRNQCPCHNKIWHRHRVSVHYWEKGTPGLFDADVFKPQFTCQKWTDCNVSKWVIAIKYFKLWAPGTPSCGAPIATKFGGLKWGQSLGQCSKYKMEAVVALFFHRLVWWLMDDAIIC